jgi:hypothetical protein
LQVLGYQLIDASLHLWARHLDEQVDLISLREYLDCSNAHLLFVCLRIIGNPLLVIVVIKSAPMSLCALFACLLICVDTSISEEEAFLVVLKTKQLLVKLSRDL